jgi:hypothetical protein
VNRRGEYENTETTKWPTAPHDEGIHTYLIQKRDRVELTNITISLNDDNDRKEGEEGKADTENFNIIFIITSFHHITSQHSTTASPNIHPRLHRAQRDAVT